MDYPFEGIPTVPPRKDMDHMAFFCGGCRYRVTARPDWTAARVKQALFAGGIARANKPEGVRNTPGIQARLRAPAAGVCCVGLRAGPAFLVGPSSVIPVRNPTPSAPRSAGRTWS